MAGISDLKTENIRKVRACFYEGGVWTKNELSQRTGLSLAGTTNVLKLLLQEGMIIQSGKADSAVGRKSKQYMLDPDHCHIGCITAMYGRWQHSFSAESYRLSGERVYRRRAEDAAGEPVLILALVNDLLVHDPLLTAVTISLPGVARNGVVETCDIAALEHVDLAGAVTQRFHIPCIIENDIALACAGFAKTAGEGASPALIYQPEVSLTGCSAIVNGRIIHGSSLCAGQIRYLLKAGSQSAREILLQQMKAICTILNPDTIGWYSDILTDEEISFADLQLPQQLNCSIVRVTDIRQLIAEGLFAAGIQYLIQNHTGGEHVS